ncbi:MAG: AsmA-like C-terminal region-containing protein [Deltaproteobacteria bacterium]
MSRSGLLGLLLLLLLLPVVLAGAVVLRAHRLLVDPASLAGVFPPGLGAVAEFEAIDVDFWPPGIVVRGIQVPDRSIFGPGQLVHADAAWLRVGVRALLAGEVVVEELVIEKPVLRIVHGEGGWNLAAHLEAFRPPESFALLRVEALRARLIYRDRTRPGVAEFELRNANLIATRASLDEGWQVELVGDSPGGEADGRVEVAVRMPDRSGETVEVQAELRGIEGARFDEFVQLIGGEMPFGTRSAGMVSGRLVARLPDAMPPVPVLLTADLDYSEAEILSSQGWVLKPYQVPLALEVGVQVDAAGSRLESVLARSGALRLSLIRSEEEGEENVLVAGSEGLDGRTLERFLPMLAGLRPRGALELTGELRPAAEGSHLHLGLRGGRLALLSEERRWTMAAVDLQLGLRARGDVTVGVEIIDLEGAGFGVGLVRLGYVLREGQPSQLTMLAVGGGRSGAELEVLELSARVSEDRMDMDRLFLRAFGGEVVATGVLERVDAAAWDLRLDPTWQGLDFARLLAFAGPDIDASGTTDGRALLATSGTDLDGLAANLSGAIDFRLERGLLGQFNLARTGLAGLAAVPGLGAAVRDGLGDSVPGLGATNTKVESLHAIGTLRGGVFSVADFAVLSPTYSFAGDGVVGPEFSVDLAGDLGLSARTIAALRMDVPLLDAVFGEDEEFRIPLRITGQWPDLRGHISSRFSRALAGRALRRGGESSEQILLDLLGRGR